MRLEAVEVALLQSLLEELTAVLQADTDDDPVAQRLFPAAYPGDDAADAEYRSFTQDALRGERLERVSACAGELAAVAAGGDVELGDPDVARRWIQVLNDLRLALGTRLGVTQDDDRDIDPNDPGAQPWLVYSWLTALQDAVVHTLLP